MRRAGIITIVALALLAVGSASVAAKPATTFTARANHAAQGGQLRVQAKVKHPMRGSTFTATAVVHFASGDVTVELLRRGKSFVAQGRVPVADDEATGPVSVDVTITYNGVPQMVTASGVIEPGDEDDEGDDDDGGGNPEI